MLYAFFVALFIGRIALKLENECAEWRKLEEKNMKNKKDLQVKKAMKRLNKAVEFVNREYDVDGYEYDYIIAPRRAIAGAEMRKLVKRCYKTLDSQGRGWLFWDRPRFNNSRRYCLTISGQGLYISLPKEGR